jgi:uncharacterized protein with NRDE domain
MCTIAILIDIVAGAPLVIAANRDELYSRPTRGPEVLVATPRVVGGVDELSGGTWLAVRADARFAAVTNQRALAPQMPAARSRGLVVRELAVSDEPDVEVAGLDPTQYASMNLVWGQPGRVSAAYVRRELATVEIGVEIDSPGSAGARSNAQRCGVQIERLGPGIHVMCNDRIGAPGFPRGERLAVGIRAAIAAGAGWPELGQELMTLLADHTHVAPTRATHLPIEIERELTATCIHTPLYGTRSSTIVAFSERQVIAYLHADGPPCTTPFRDRTELFVSEP